MFILRSCLRLMVLLTIIFTCLLMVLEFALQIGSTERLLSRGSFLGGADQYMVNREWHKKYDKRNSIGHRDREYSIKKPKNTFRILVLGDSMTFGHGIKKLEDTWHEKLENLLNQDSGPVSFEVISLAINGWNTDSQLFELFKVGFKYSPDMILVGFYMNDVPVPIFFDCKYKDIDFLPDDKVSKWIIDNSKAYDLIKFYGNRLLENLRQKESYENCLNKRYESYGWDMEEVYLDTILRSAQIKNIHLMLATIPVINKLGNDYSLKNSHQKIKAYCKQKKIVCIDLYDDGFKDLDSNRLRLSKNDRHLNEEGTEVVAQTVYKKLKPLKTYGHLEKLSGAFGLSELLDSKHIVKELDKRFIAVEKGVGVIKINFENENLQVKNKNGQVQYTQKLLYQNKPIIYETILDSNGKFQERKVTYYKENDSNIYSVQNKVINGHNHITYKTKMQRNTDYKVNKQVFFGQYVKEGLAFYIKLFDNLNFPDIKSLEHAIFQNKIDYSKGLSNKEMRIKIQSIKNNNSKLFENLSSNLQTFFNLKEESLKENYNILILYEVLHSLHALRYNNYLSKLENEIFNKQPSITSLRALLLYSAVTKNYKLYNRLNADHPELK